MNQILNDRIRSTGLIRKLRRARNQQYFKIVTYHSISAVETIFDHGTSLRCDPHLFEQQIDYLVAHYNIISINDLLDRLSEGESLDRAVVLTFDDGYADALRNAMPILFRRRLPMLVFPVASVIGNSDLMWQHKVAWLVHSGHANRLADAMRGAGYPSLEKDEDRQQYARRCFNAELPALLEDVLLSIGQKGSALAGQLRPYLEFDDVQSADPGLVTFGNHTLSHPILSALSEQQQRHEITEGAARLKTITGRTISVFAYPFGLRQHYTEQTSTIVQETGHRAAMDMRRRVNRVKQDQFALSRHPAPADCLSHFEEIIEDLPSNTNGSGGMHS